MKNIECLHSAVLAQAKKTPTATALVARNTNNSYEYVSYETMAENALKIAAKLDQQGIGKSSLIAVVLPKGFHQVYATIGIQCIGGAYVPVGVHQPLDRMHIIFETAKISAILTDKEHAPLLANNRWKVIIIEDALLSTPLDESKIVEDPASLAYIIFTSGTTGVPKGVMIAHHAASNTIRDINERFNVSTNDACIAISELDFDLSVYDLFGMLSCGGKVIVLSEETKKEANVWKEIAKDQKITLWNSVPALFEMFTIVAGDKANAIPLKKIMLSGDWIPLQLYGTTKKLWQNCRFISLGGATEVSIWSVFYEVESLQPEWKSIPYGKALLNQKIKVMNENGKECDVDEAGELWIGGVGVAEGYLNQPELTKERFPIQNGERWYRTGDKVRMKQDGNTEFLGRLDTQIKLGGFRIELGEIENVIKKNPHILNAAAVVVENQNKKEIAAAIIPSFKTNVKTDYKYSLTDNYNDESLQDRINAVAAFIQRVLSKFETAPEQMKDTFALWKNWLFNYGFEHIQPTIDSDFAKKLNSSENIELLQNVIAGNIPETDLLQTDLFAPEKLLSESIFFNSFISNAVSKALAMNAKSIAFLNARTGIGAKKFLETLEKNNLEIVLMDESMGMLDMARETLDPWKSQLKYKQLDLSTPVQDLGKYDMVIDAGFMHTYSNPQEALSFAYMILKNGGKFMALDFENFDPIAIVSSAVLEKGFRHYTRLRRYTSLLTDEEWEILFKELPFAQVEFTNDSHFSQTIVATKSLNDENILDTKFDDYLKEHLVPYMIPARTEVFVKFPLTNNAKVNRKAIADALKKSGSATDVNENYEGREADIAAIWKSLLSIEHIDRYANFFEIGGDSLLATRFLEKVHTQFGVEITLREIFENAELNKIAKILDEGINALGDMEEGEI